MMKKQYWLILLTLIFTSCSTIVNSPNTKILFYSQNEDVSFTLNNDTTRVYRTNNARIPVKRSKRPLIVKVLNDSLPDYTYQIDSKLSNSFVLGNLASGYIGYLIDLTNQKMYTYPDRIQIEKDTMFLYTMTGNRTLKNFAVLVPDSTYRATSANSMAVITKRKAKPGKVNLIFTPLSVNAFNWEAFDNRRDSDNWAAGASLGLNYYLKPNLRLSASFEAMIHSSSIATCYVGSYSTNYASVLLGKVQIGKPVYKNLWVDAGLQMFNSFYKDYEYIETEEINYEGFYESWSTNRYERKNNLGLALSIGYNIGKNTLTLSYYPSFISFTTKGYDYQYNHIISLSFGFGRALGR